MIMFKRLVPDFGGRFCPIFGQTEQEFFSVTIRSLLYEKSLNQFYIRISIVGIT